MNELNINKRYTPVTNRNGRIYGAGAVVFNSNSQSTTTTQPEYTQIINGYGFVKASGTTLTFDNITYQPLSTAINTSNIANQNVLSATKLTTPKNINGVAFDGSQNITVYDATKLPTTGGTISGNLSVTGALNVAGGSFITSAQTVTTKDNLIVINSGEVGAGVTNTLAGIQVDRGQSTDYQFVFDENTDLFKIGQVGNLQAVTTRENTPINGNIMTWDSSSKKILSNINPSSYSLSGHNHTGVYLDNTDLSNINYGERIGSSYYYTSSQVFIPFFKFGSEIASDGNYVKGTLISTRGATKIGVGSNSTSVIEIFAKNSIWQAGSNQLKCYFNSKIVSEGDPNCYYFATAMVDGALWFGFRFYNFQDFSLYFTGESSNPLNPIVYKKTYNGEVVYNQEVNDSITKYNVTGSEYHNGYKIWNESNLTPSNYSLTGHSHTEYQPVGNYSLTSHTHSSYSLTGHSHSEYQPVGNYLDDTDVYTWAKQATKPSYTASEVGAASSGHSHTGVYQPVGSYVLTGDTRLTDSRPASDVSAWAKAATKPSYTYTEVGAASSGHTHSNYSLTGHTHSELQPLATAWNTSNFNPSSYSLSGHNHTGIYQPVGSYVLTTDTRLTDARPASDVYAWAKAANKPSYSYSEVGAASSTHNHTGIYQPVGNYSTVGHTHTIGDLSTNILVKGSPVTDSTYFSNVIINGGTTITGVINSVYYNGVCCVTGYYNTNGGTIYSSDHNKVIVNLLYKVPLPIVNTFISTTTSYATMKLIFDTNCNLTLDCGYGNLNTYAPQVYNFNFTYLYSTL